MIKWPIVQLGNVIQQRNGCLLIDDFTEYKRCRVQLHAQGIVLRDTVSGAEIKTKKQQICKAGDFLVAEIDAKVGGFGIVPDELAGAIVSSHYFLFEIDEEKLNRRFLDYFIRTPVFRDQVAAQGSTNYAAIRPNQVLGYEIPLPPLAEQRRIVAWIEELAAKIDEVTILRRKTIEETETLWERAACAVMEMTNQYSNQPLRDIATIRGGGTPPKSNPYYWSGQIPWITPKDMKARQISDSIDHITKAAVQETAAKLIEPGAVVVVVRGMILAHTFPSAVLRVRAAINQDMKALIPNGEIDAEFLCSYLWATNATIIDLVEKSTHDTRKLETEKLLAIPIPLPPIPEQRCIVAELDRLQARVFELRTAQANSRAELRAFLGSVLDRAFSGRL